MTVDEDMKTEEILDTEKMKEMIEDMTTEETMTEIMAEEMMSEEMMETENLGEITMTKEMREENTVSIEKAPG